MNHFLIDVSLLVIAVIGAFVVTQRIKRKAGVLFSTLLLFPPLLVFLNMWAHTVAVSAANLKRFVAGSFQYGFTVYSHLLFGVTFIFLSGLTIHCTKKYITGYKQQKRNIHLLNLATSLLFLPVGFINPIGFLPVMTSVFSSLILIYNPFASKVADTYSKEVKLTEAGHPVLNHV